MKTHFVVFRATRGDKHGDEIFKKFNIMGTPTELLVGSDGKEIDWIVGYGPPPEKFRDKLEKSNKGIDTFVDLSERYAKDSKNVEVVFKLASKYDDRYSKDMQEKAAKLYKEVLVLDPDGKKGTTEYGTDQVPYTEVAEMSLAQMALFSRGAKRDPEPLKAFIKKYPESKTLPNAYSYLGNYYGYTAPKEEAVKFFEEYVAKYPENPYALSAYIGRIIRDKDKLDRGIELGEKIKDQMKYNPRANFMKDLAELYALKGDGAKAEEIYGKDFMEGQVNRLGYDLVSYANFWIGQNRNTESVQKMADLIVQLDPENFYRIQSAAGIYCKLSKVDKALAVFGPEYIKKSWDKPDSLSSYASFWAQQEKNLDHALEAAKRSVELSPDSAYGWAVLAVVHSKIKNYDEAIKAGEKAVELADPEIKDYYKQRLDAIKKAQAGEKK